MPKISVILPVYNVEQYLRQSLDSVAAQSLKDIEIICVDDGSSDSSLSILQEYSKKDSRFIILSEPNQGPGSARNLALDIARGKYLFFLDPDDWIEVDSLSLLYNFAESKQASLVQFNHNEFNDYYAKSKPRDLAKRLSHKFQKVLNNPDGFNWKDMVGSELVHMELFAWGKFYKTEFIKKHNIRFGTTRVAEDIMFSVPACLLVDRMYMYPEFLYYHRVRPGSLINSQSRVAFDVFSSIDLLHKFLLDHGLFEELSFEFDHWKRQVLFCHYSMVGQGMVEEYLDKCRTYLSSDSYQKLLKQVRKKLNFIEKLFSLTTLKENGIKYKIVTILGIGIKLKKKKQ